MAGAFMAPYVYGLFWKRANRAGATVSFLTGLCLSLGLSFYWGKPGIPLAGATAMLVPLVVMPVVTLLTPAPEPGLVAKAFGPAAAEEPVSAPGAEIAK